MAEEEVIVTRFTADLSDLDKGVADYEKSLNDATGASNALDKSTKNLGATTGDLAAKYKVAASEGVKAAQATSQIGTEAAKADGPLKRMGASIVGFGRGARDGFRTAIKEAGGFRGAVSQLGNSVRGSLGAVASGFQSISGSIGQVGSQIPIVGGLASALGPVGIAASAVAGGILAIAKNTDAGATALDGFSRGAGLTFDRLTGSAVRFWETLKNAFSSADEGGNSLLNVIERIGQGFSVFLTLGASSAIRDSLEADAEAGQRLAEQFDNLEDLQSSINLKTAQNEPALRRNLAALRDTTKPVEERLRIADEITRIEEESLGLRQKALRTELDIVGAQIAQQIARKGKADDALRFRFNELRANLAQAEADSVSITERVAVRRASIVEQEEARKTAARNKSAEDAKKAQERIAKNAETIAAAEQSVDKVLDQLAEDRLARRRTQEEQEVAIVEKKYADLVKAAQESFEKIRAVTSESGQSEVARREAEAVIAIDKAKNDELEALEAQRAEQKAATREAQLESIRVALLTETEIEREAILTRLDEQRAAAEASIENLDERNRVIAELTANAEEQLTAITTAANTAQLEEEKRVSDELLARRQQEAAAIGEFALGLTEVIAGAASGNEELAKNASKAIIDLALKTAEQLALVAVANATTQSLATQQSVATGGTLGLVQAALLTALIKGVMATLRASLAGAYEGEEYIKGKPMWSGKDGHLRRVHTGERIVAADKNARHWDALDAIHKGRFQDYIDSVHIAPLIEAMGHRDDARIAALNDSDTGRRIAASVMMAPFYDKNIIDALGRSTSEERRQSELLAIIARGLRPRSSRYY